MHAQHIINSFEFARKSLEIHDIIRVSQFLRLKDLIVLDNDCLIDWTIKGSIDEQSKPSLLLNVTGLVWLKCQRCLEPFRFQLDIATKFILVNDENSIPLDEDNFDEDYLVGNDHLNLDELLEDEILLALPFAPKHELDECVVKEDKIEIGKPNPFAVLRSLKSDRQ